MHTFKKLLELFLTFFRIGLTTFGGGYAMIPIVRSTVVESKKWIDDQEMIKILAIAETTPGPIAINMATFVGYKRGGVLGSIFATIGVVLPSFIIILIIALFLNNLMQYSIVKSIFNGIRCAVAVLIVTTAINMFKKLKKSPFVITLYVLTLILLLLANIFAFDFSSIFLIIAGLIIGVIFVLINDYINKQKLTKENIDKKTENDVTLPKNDEDKEVK